MGIYFDGFDVPAKDGGEPWEWESYACGERIDLDHYYDITSHIWEHNK